VRPREHTRERSRRAPLPPHLRDHACGSGAPDVERTIRWRWQAPRPSGLGRRLEGARFAGRDRCHRTNAAEEGDAVHAEGRVHQPHCRRSRGIALTSGASAAASAPLFVAYRFRRRLEALVRWTTDSGTKRGVMRGVCHAAQPATQRLTPGRLRGLRDDTRTLQRSIWDAGATAPTTDTPTRMRAETDPSRRLPTSSI
jgi:hypothetical protein